MPVREGGSDLHLGRDRRRGRREGVAHDFGHHEKAGEEEEKRAAEGVAAKEEARRRW